MLKLKIPEKIFERMLRQAESEAPIEACGILAGKNSKVEQIYQMTNADNSSDHFTLEPKEQFKVIKDIRSEGLEMLAIYHSHPETPARPSAVDISMAYTPDVVYVILSLQDPDSPVVKGFIIDNTNVTEVNVEIIEE